MRSIRIQVRPRGSTKAKSVSRASPALGVTVGGGVGTGGLAGVCWQCGPLQGCGAGVSRLPSACESEVRICTWSPHMAFAVFAEPAHAATTAANAAIIHRRVGKGLRMCGPTDRTVMKEI